MNMELIKSFINLREQLHESGVIGLNIHEDEIHVRTEVLLKEEGVICEYLGGDHYPYEVSKDIEGIRFFARCDAKELSHYPQFKEQIKAELQKQLDGLEEDVILDGMGEEHVS